MKEKELLEEIAGIEAQLVGCDAKQEKRLKSQLREARIDLLDEQADNDEREFEVAPSFASYDAFGEFDDDMDDSDFDAFN